MLNSKQEEAVKSTERLLLVLAGPGSGKTKVIVEKINFLLSSQGVDVGNVLAITFTNKAAREIRERFEQMSNPFTSNRVWISTFHSLGLNLLRKNIRYSTLKENFSVIDSEDSKKILKNILGSTGRDVDKNEVKDILHAFSNYRNGGYLLDEYEDDVYQAYRKKLNEINALDFDDILTYSYKLLAENIKLLEIYRERFKYLLVDEYQDTNSIQHKFVNLFINHNQQTILVGDIDQSIYGWRNADPEEIKLLLPKAKVIRLTGNYRSTNNIVKLCNDLIVNNFIPNREGMYSAGDLEGEPVEFYRCLDSKNESEKIVKQLKNLPGSKAVLIRTNSMSREIEESLARNGVPYSIVGGIRFYERAEIKDALAYIKFALNPFDLLSFERIINTPKRKMGPKSIEKVLAFSQNNNVNLLEATLLLMDKNVEVYNFCKDIVLIKDLIEEDFSEALKYVFNQVGLIKYYRELEDGKSKLENLSELLNAVKDYSFKSAAYLDGIEIEYSSGVEFALKFIENATINSVKESSSISGIEVMTIHMSKGKEFDNVWVPGVEDTLIPHYLPGEQPDDEEERRLLYVACSRAGKKLFLSSCYNRLKFGEYVSNPISPYFREIEKNVILYDESKVFGSDRFTKDKKTYHPKVSKDILDRVELENLTVGSEVMHPVFGNGVVIEINENDITISFDGVIRSLSPKLAPLKIVKN